ncbi:hypothetical protein NUW54_g12497 [Trametes sanguinea]|uniref:Uncharacterized protein n=1 Tax=Trametes sanguinea TaxID=158606 RepID=A0ACC1MWW7_9APHY|nr:hypothetical protein NUW54_g12497 [Trametes sanguinea]
MSLSVASCQHAPSALSLSCPPSPLSTSPHLSSPSRRLQPSQGNQTSSMAPKTRMIHQNLLDYDFDTIAMQEDVLESKLSKDFFDDFFTGLPSPRIVGRPPRSTSRTGLLRVLRSL